MRDEWFPARRFLSVKDIDDSLSLLIALEHLAQMGGSEGFFEERGMCSMQDCAVSDCEWHEWLPYSSCTCSCGGSKIMAGSLVAVKLWRHFAFYRLIFSGTLQ